MVVKNLSIEIKRKNLNLIVLGLHPGTVKSKLSEPFIYKNSNVNNIIFTADYSVSKMINVLKNLTVEDSGKFLAWNGKEIAL